MSNLYINPHSTNYDIREAHTAAVAAFDSFIKEQALPRIRLFFSSREDKIEECVMDWIDLNIQIYQKTQLDAAKLQVQKYVGRIDKLKIRREWEPFLNLQRTKRKLESKPEAVD